jgi:hypothetical protein
MCGPTEIVVRGKCACGRRYRVRNAREGAVVTCPACGRTITITRADLRCAEAGAQLIPLQPEQTELREAVPLDDAVLWPAPPGSRPGLTGRRVFDHDEALLHAAMHPELSEPGEAAPACKPAGPALFSSFLYDLLSGLALCASVLNAMAVLAMAGMLILSSLVFAYIPFFGLISQGVLAAYLIAFFWHVMLVTADGQDELPLVWSDFSWWDDALRPLLYMVLLSVLILPAWIVLGGEGPFYRPWLWWLVLPCSFIWPMAVLSVAVGRSLAFLRPDWLLLSIWRCRAPYVLVWLVFCAQFAQDYAVGAVTQRVSGVPLAERWIVPAVAQVLQVYMGFVLFRGIGLLYRYFGSRFPWGVYVPRSGGVSG